MADGLMVQQELRETRRVRAEAQASACEVEALLDCLRGAAGRVPLDAARKCLQPDLFGG